MQTYRVYENLALLNGLDASEAEGLFLQCCGSAEWARHMADARPFAMLEDLFSTAERIWHSLPPADRLEAFAGGSMSSSSEASSERRFGDEFAAAVELYEARFGFGFVINSSGKTLEEMLAVCRARLRNSAVTELAIAAREQHAITEVRLGRILER